VAAELHKMGFDLLATPGTASAVSAAGLPATVANKLSSGCSPSVLDLMRDGRIGLVINTPSGPISKVDEVKIRGEAILRDISIVTTESGARATLSSIRYMRTHTGTVRALQDYIAEMAATKKNG